MFYYDVNNPESTFAEDEARRRVAQKHNASLPASLGQWGNDKLSQFGIKRAYQAQPGYTHEIIDGEWQQREMTINELAEVLLPELAAYRYEIETGGITVNGITIQTDRQARADITAARIKASEDSTYTTKWKTPDGFVTLDASTILTIADAVHNHVQSAFDAEATVEDEIDNGTLTTLSEVKARFDELMGQS